MHPFESKMKDIHYQYYQHRCYHHHYHHYHHRSKTLAEARLSSLPDAPWTITTIATTTSTTTVTTTNHNTNHHHHHHHHYHRLHHHHYHYDHHQTTSETLAEDRLSSLPDALLTHILSLLSTKDSVRTTVLSTRWKYLFAHVPALSFHCDKRETLEKFVRFVYWVLHVHKVLHIRSFRLFVHTPSRDSDIYSWICNAIRRNARLLEVESEMTQPCPLPLNLFTCQMLVDLKLTGDFVFGVTDTVSLPNLKTLIIKRCKILSGDLAERLFSSCPVLEELTVDSCRTPGIKILSISVPSLKSLTVCCIDSECEWKLNVPNLEYIHCEGYSAKWYSVSILKSLHKAYIRLKDYDEVEDGQIWELVNKFDEVQFLSLSDDSMESLAHDSFSLPMFNKLKTLELKLDYCQGWNCIQTLLERAPRLELLAIPERGFLVYNQEFPEIDILLPESIPICFSRSLKQVKLSLSEWDNVEYGWLGYLLKNAKVLEKLIIFVTSLRKEEYFAYLERQYVLRKKLLTLPRGSKTCEIVVKEK